ncbi:hypothetical protein MiSe_62850 [Microseira wollei NIES-4236]|uniref:Uncharacterized protein n=1 Tax=Microseira wollei NIES-4236 TaxID=2530354 RepID=A0AAV3XIR2_9CYAN|nr:hypothetical protein MiSe_62850 [Microseira wollei NIES-4236]
MEGEAVQVAVRNQIDTLSSKETEILRTEKASDLTKV